MVTPLSKYPRCLIDELAKYGQKPTGDLDWDKCVLDCMKRKASDSAIYAAMEIGKVIKKANEDKENERKTFPNLSDPAVYELHSKLFLHIANIIVIEPQDRAFIVDEHNEKILRFYSTTSTIASWQRVFSRSVAISCIRTSCYKVAPALARP